MAKIRDAVALGIEHQSPLRNFFTWRKAGQSLDDGLLLIRSGSEQRSNRRLIGFSFSFAQNMPDLTAIFA